MSADPGGDEIAERFAEAVGLEQNVKLKNGRTPNKKEHQLERTVLTNWKKKAQNMKKGTEEKSPGMTSTGAVRPPPEAWNRNSNSSRDIPDFGYDTHTTYDDPYVGSTTGGRVGDTKLLKIGLGVFGGIALILGTMLSYFYIQKKNKDDKHKRQRAKNQSPGGARGGSPHNIPYPGHPFPGNYPYPGAYEQAGYDHQLPPGPYEGIPGPIGPAGPPGQPGQYPPQYPYEAQYYPYMQQYDEFAVPPQYMPPEQYYEQQAYDQNYYNMCQDYIQKQRQLQYESHTMTQPGYSAVMDYVDKIGDNLKTPKAKNRVKDGNPQGTPHPIITRRGSMKSLAQSEASCWTEDLSDKEDDKKSLDRSEMCCGQSENDKNDGASQKSDSAYGSRGSIQSPNGSPQDLKDLPVVNSSHMFQEEEQDMSHTSDHGNDSQKLDDSAHDTSHDESSDEPKVLKTMIRQKSDNNTKLRKVTTFKSMSDSEE